MLIHCRSVGHRYCIASRFLSVQSQLLSHSVGHRICQEDSDDDPGIIICLNTEANLLTIISLPGSPILPPHTWNHSDRSGKVVDSKHSVGQLFGCMAD